MAGDADGEGDAVAPQHLFDRFGDQRRLGAQAILQLRVASEMVDGEADQIDHRVETARRAAEC